MKDFEAKGCAEQERLCSSCKQPCKGHNGRCGKQCAAPVSTPEAEIPLENLAGVESEQPVMESCSKADETVPNDRGDVSSTLMKELINQMTTLNRNMEFLVRTNIDIQNRLETTSRPEVPVAATARTPEHQVESQWPLKLVQSARQGEFINLIDFLQCPGYSASQTELEPIVTDTGELRFKPKKAQKLIKNFGIWLQAWNAYEQVVVGNRPELFMKFAVYRQFIQDSDKKYMWSAVMA